MGGAEKKKTQSFGKKGITIARPPSVIDQHVGSHSLHLHACWCMDGCGRLSEEDGGEILPTKFKLGVCCKLNKDWQ